MTTPCRSCNPLRCAYRALRSTLSACALLAVLLACAGASARPEVSLDGTWDFRFASDDRGDTEQWYKSGEFDRSIAVPGVWNAQGVGSETPILRHSAVGVGWYRRAFHLPDEWHGKHVWLRIGAAYHSARVWLNGQFIAKCIGYSLSHRLDLTPYIQADNPQMLVIAVDNRPDVSAMGGYYTYPWGGIYGAVHIEATGEVWVKDAFVRSDPANHAATVEVSIARENATETASPTVAYRLSPWSREGPSPTAIAEGESTAKGETASFAIDMAQAPLWSPREPNLLVLELSLKRDGRVVDTYAVRFGYHALTVRGNDFYLNGDRFFFRGYGKTFVHPLTLGDPGDKEFWVRHLSRRKEFGFNGLRTNSTMYAETIYDAADEVGMFIQPELPICYSWESIKRRNANAEEYLTSLWRQYITQMRNHPSVFGWGMANELYFGHPMAEKLYAEAKQLDPGRPVIDSDGVHLYDNRATLDYLAYMFDELVLPWGAYHDKYMLSLAPEKPVIAHEFSNISVFPDPYARDSFTGVVKPVWLDKILAAAEQRGVTQYLPAMVKASEKLQATLLKVNFEAARISPYMDGYHQYLFEDYWGQSTGMVNQMEKLRALSLEQVRQFNDEAALLWDRTRVSYGSREQFDVRVYISDFRPRKADDFADVEICFDNQRVKIPKPALVFPKGERGVLGPWYARFQAPEVQAPTKLLVQAHALGFQNEWPIWVFPQTGADAWATNSKVLVSPWLTEEVLKQVEAGARAIITNEKGVFPTLQAQFKTPWWWGGDVVTGHSYGTMIDSHPAMEGFPHDGYGDLQMYVLLEDRPVTMLDDVAPGITPIVWDLDIPWLLRRKAYLWEAKVGDGRMLVSTLRLSRQARETDPGAQWLYERLQAYAAGDSFAPAVEAPRDWLEERVALFGLPNPGALLEGCLGVDAPSPLGAEMGYSHRDVQSSRVLLSRKVNESKAVSYRIRQNEAQDSLAWHTETVPEDWPYAEVHFLWAGSMGCQNPAATEPLWWDEDVWPKDIHCNCDPNYTGRFRLEVEGAGAVDFPFVEGSGQWTDESGRIRLRFVQYRRLTFEHLGVFVLSMPTELVKRGAPLRLTVRSLPGPPIEMVEYADLKGLVTDGYWLRTFPYGDLIQWEMDGN